MSTLQRFPPTYLYYIRTNDTPSYQRHRDEKAQLQPITLHNSTHHMPRQALHKATALFSSPTQLRSRTMANPMLTAGERRKTVLGEYAPQKNNLLPYTPREKVAGGLSYGVGHFPTPHQIKKPIYSHPTLLHNINCEAFSTQADSYKEMTSTARKKKKTPVAILSPGRLSRSAGRASRSKEGRRRRHFQDTQLFDFIVALEAISMSNAENAKLRVEELLPFSHRYMRKHVLICLNSLQLEFSIAMATCCFSVRAPATHMS